ncbi:MAG: thiol:disulfide interchange protein DsbG [Francisellaceae bacterium]
MKKRLFALIIIIALVIIAALYFFSIETSKRHNKLIARELIDNAFPQYTIVKQFDTGLNLEGFILADKKQPDKITVTYTTEDGQFIVNGNLIRFDPKTKYMTDMNAIYVDKFNKNEQAEKLLQALQKTHYIEQGKADAPHQIYVVIDPNCKFCHALFEATQSAINKGQLAVRWVIVGIVKPSSPQKAMAILAAKDPLSALKENEEKFDYAKEEGGIAPISAPDKAVIEFFNQNISALKGLVNVVPTIVYKNPQGFARISGGAKLPLKASKEAQKANEQKIDDFLILTGKTWN